MYTIKDRHLNTIEMIQNSNLYDFASEHHMKDITHVCDSAINILNNRLKNNICEEEFSDDDISKLIFVLNLIEDYPL